MPQGSKFISETEIEEDYEFLSLSLKLVLTDRITDHTMNKRARN